MSNKVRDVLSDKAIIKESLFLGYQTQGLVYQLSTLPLSYNLLLFETESMWLGLFLTSLHSWANLRLKPSASTNLLLRSRVTLHT